MFALSRAFSANDPNNTFFLERHPMPFNAERAVGTHIRSGTLMPNNSKPR